MAKKCKRCPFDGCGERIPPAAALIGMCKCELCFCIAHRLPEAHNCSYIKDAEQIKRDLEMNKKKADELRCVASKV